MSAETRRGVGYGLVLIAFLVFWLHALFPADSIRTLVETRLSDPTSGRTVSIGRISARFPFILFLEPVDIQLRGKPLLRINSISIRPNDIRWTGIETFVSATVANGRISGKIGYPVVQEGIWHLHLQFSGIHIDRIVGIQQAFGRPFAGEIAGTIHPQDRGLVLTLLGKNLKIGLIDASLGPAHIAVASGEARIEYASDELRLTSVAFQGTQLSGTARGVIHLAETWTNSSIRAEASIRMHPGLLNEIHASGIRAFIASRIDREVSVQISGTVLQPKWEMTDRP